MVVVEVSVGWYEHGMNTSVRREHWKLSFRSNYFVGTNLVFAFVGHEDNSY